MCPRKYPPVSAPAAAVQYEQACAQLHDGYRRMGVQYVLLARQGMSPALAKYVIEEHPEQFHLYWSSANGDHWIYRFEYGRE